MKKTPFNPSSVGFPAKVWECLRRNEKFRSLLEEVEKRSAAAPADSGSLRREAHWGAKKNDWAYHALTFLLPLNDEGTPCAPAMSCATAWPDTPKEFRKSFEWLFSRNQPTPRKVISPPFEAIRKLSAKDARIRNKAANELKQWRPFAERLWQDYCVVAIPCYPFHKKHRAKILEEIGEFISSELADARVVEKQGRRLGTERCWRAYLSVCKFLEMGKDEQTAVNLAAYETEEREKEETLLRDCDKLSKQRHSSTVRRRFRGLKRAIRSVYPKFAPIEINT